MQFYPFAVYLIVSSIITLVSAWIALRRNAPGSQTLGVLLISMTIWGAADTLQSLQVSLEAKLFWLDVMMLGVVSAPPLFLLFALKFTRNDRWVTHRTLTMLFSLPVIVTLLSWTNEYHHLVLSSVGMVERNGLILLELTRGPIYFINVALSYSLILAGVFVLIYGAMRSGPLFRNQYRLILLGCIVPFAFSLYTQYFFSSLNGFDLSSVTFGISGVIFLVAVLRTGLMNLIPVARSRLIEKMQDGVLVLDALNRVVDFNPTMKIFLGDQHAPYLGKPASEILGNWLENSESFLSGSDSQTEMRIPNDPSRYLDLRVTPLYDHYHQINGRLIVFRDITERKDVEKKLRNANRRMQSQLIEIGILQSQLREQAIRDPLTGLFNRRYLEETLDRELARAARESYPVGIIMIDIDHFKQVNDTYGHEAGDHVLKTLADLLAKQSRRGDFACRYGGEEFVLVMPNINNRTAIERAEALRKALNAMQVSYGRYHISTTYSMGISSYPANGATREEILRAADQAMYAAKDAGRDHIRSFDEVAVK